MNVKRRAVLWGLPFALAGCSSPPAQYYRLAAVPGTAGSGGPNAVGVRGINIPGYLDQNNIVKPSGAYQFDSFANELWAEPLGDMLQGVLVQDLAQRLPDATVVASGGAITVPADVLVEINVLSFEPDASGQVTLNAQIALKSGADRALWATGNFQKSADAGAGAAGTVAAMSTLWGMAADQAAAMIVAGWAARGAMGSSEAQPGQ